MVFYIYVYIYLYMYYSYYKYTLSLLSLRITNHWMCDTGDDVLVSPFSPSPFYGMYLWFSIMNYSIVFSFNFSVTCGTLRSRYLTLFFIPLYYVYVQTYTKYILKLRNIMCCLSLRSLYFTCMMCTFLVYWITSKFS